MEETKNCSNEWELRRNEKMHTEETNADKLKVSETDAILNARCFN